VRAQVKTRGPAQDGAWVRARARVRAQVKTRGPAQDGAWVRARARVRAQVKTRGPAQDRAWVRARVEVWGRGTYRPHHCQGTFAPTYLRMRPQTEHGTRGTPLTEGPRVALVSSMAGWRGGCTPVQDPREDWA
jgi:hypothetical protein